MAFFKWFKRGKKEENLQEEINNELEQSIEEVENENNEIEDINDNKTEEVKENISDKVEEVKENVSDKVEEVKENISNKVEEVKENISNKVEEVKENVSDKVEEVKENISNKVEEVKENISNKVEEVKENVSDKVEEVKENISDKVEEAKENIIDKIEEVKENISDKVEEVKENISDKVEEVKENISDKIEEAKENIIDKVEEVKENIIKKKEDTTDILEETEEEMKEKEEPKKKGFFAKIKMGLSKTRDSILNRVEQVLSSFTKIDEELFEELEESLIMSDIGVETSIYIMEKVRAIVKVEKIKEVADIKNVIVRVISEILEEETEEFNLKFPSVILIIGVNGVGKTTTIGKLANNYKSQGKKVILAAGDTFRAAAIDQLQVWGDRSGIDVIKHQEGSDPAAVVFDAIQAGKARGADLLICDTAGRLHNKKNLMEELKKIARIVNRENPDAQIETLLVLDATTGQNALQQAKLFSEVSEITGIVLTKLDGTAKGGVVIAIKNELKIPVRFIGVGEGIEDLRPFDAKEFSKALFE